MRSQSGKCYNDANKLKIKDRIKSILSTEVRSVLGISAGQTVADINITRLLNKLDNIAEGIYKDSKISSVMEYSRSIHAEMDVITSMARKQNGDTKDKILLRQPIPATTVQGILSHLE